MKRARRHKIVLISVFFLIYSIIHVYSENNEYNNYDMSNDDDGDDLDLISRLERSMTGKQEDTAADSRNGVDDGVDNLSSTTALPETTDEAFSTESSPTTQKANESSNELKPRRIGCIPPAIEQFPQPLMGPKTRRHGGLTLHFFVAIYTFIGLAIVCDEYFVSSLDRICEELKMSPDVAGATFMAAGSSAPELATVVIGVFFAKDDIGVSGVIGSAVFNIMFVVSLCGLFTSTALCLNWWPLVRDCFFYSLSILIMLFTIYNEKISWGESLFMLCMYVVYCIALHFNPFLEKWAQTWPVPCVKPEPEQTEETGLVSYKSLKEDRARRQSYTSPEDKNAATAAIDGGWNDTPNQTGGTGYDQTGYGAQPTQQQWDPNTAWDPNAAWDPNTAWAGDQTQQVPMYTPTPASTQIPMEQQQATAEVPQQQQQQAAATGANAAGQNKQQYYKPKEQTEEKINPLIRPTDMNIFIQAKWIVVYPIHYMCIATIPDCKTEKFKNWYPFTFLISMVWISFYSYFMVWMITIIGSTLGIPDTVMGLTFVAAGVSVPDALSSIAVIKEGYGDMAVANAVGSNVFDILICLGLPWFIQTAIIKPGSHVNVISKGLTYSTLSLLSTVGFLVVATHLNGWKLDRRLGIMLMLWYIFFITVASLYELNVFGQLNPLECESDY